jgi:serine/threonine protein kinase
MNPQMFGRYLLLDKVAAGGMAEVWRAKITGEANFQRILAIKKILPHVSEDEDFITMFTDEALITASLVHANIGQVYEFSKVEDVFYIAMEYISGKDLKSLWSWSKARGQVMPVELAAFIVAKMCDGLDYAHSRRDNAGNVSGVVHRDISPQNVLISWEGDVKVIDFGIAKATEKSGKTRPGTLKGKFAYMAPEQIRGLPLDGRSDIFALGVVLYELCTGQRGFQADSEFSLLEMVRNVEIRPPSLLNQALPPEMERIIYKALAKDRNQRYATCSDMSEDLQRFLLMRGKPPQARDLSAFMRENFTVDYEKERARLESYREVNPRDFQGPEHQAKTASSTSFDIDDIVDDAAVPPGSSGSIAVSTQPPPVYAPAVTPQMSAGFAGGEASRSPHASHAPHVASTQGVIRPAAAVTAVVAAMNAENRSGATSPGTSPTAVVPPVAPVLNKVRLKTAAAVIGGVSVLLSLGAGLWTTVLQPTTTVIVTVQGPPEAMVRFDELPPTKAAPTATFPKIPRGSHMMILEANGFVSVTMPVNTTGEPALELSPTMKRVSGRLLVTSEPSGAAVTLDGKKTDKQTPATFELEADSVHEIRLNLAEHKEAVRSPVRIVGNQETNERIKLLPSVIHLRLLTSPEGAAVKVSGVDMGMTPLSIERAPDDPYPQVTFSHPGCESVTTTVPFDREKSQDRYDVTLKCR